MISDVFHVIYDALLQIIARLEIDISVAAITLGCYFPSFAIAVSIFSCSCFMLFSFVMPPSTGSPTIFPFRSIT